MTTRRLRRTATLLGTATLLVAACGGGTGPGETAAGEPPGATEAGSVPGPVTLPTVVPGSVDTADDECRADDGGTDAADTFDPDGLSGTGAGFVPLDDPVMVTAGEADWLDPEDIVMGIVHESGEAQAYPVDQMTYHHVSNTSIAGEPYLVTY